jgi:DNA-binding transcriptional MerR regulator
MKKTALKMKDLVKRTGVSKEKIHFFTREGLLPDIEKTSPNQAIYNDRHVERIQLIQLLQEKYYIPISVIKTIIKQLKSSPLDEELLWIKTTYFKPTDHFLPQEIRGEDDFIQFSGLSADRLEDFMRYDIIKPLRENGIKVFRNDSIMVGKLIGDMRKSGISFEKGFSRTALKEFRDMLIPIIDLAMKTFDEGVNKNRLTAEETRTLARKGIEYTSIFMYHMTRILFEEAIEKYFARKKKEPASE